jgi:hypothetical protein
MVELQNYLHSFSGAWEVFLLFAIPIGGGIPAGVVLAQSKGISWKTMLVLYFLSDVALALVFEPLMLFFIRAGNRYPFLAKVNAAFKKSQQKMIAKYGTKPNPFYLVMIAFGVDPMTGRAVAMAAGHHFVSGWAIAILGDMVFFTLIMVSTIWLNNLIGDGTTTAIIIMVVMMFGPGLVRKLKESRNKPIAN